MSFYAFAAAINFISSFFLGCFVLSRNWKKHLNISFALFSFCISFWSLSYFFWQISSSSELALFWCKLLMFGAIFIPVTYLHLVLVLTDLLSSRKLFLIFSYLVFGLFAIINFTDLLVHGVTPLMGFDYWPIAGQAFIWFLAAWFLYVIYSTGILFYKYSKSSGTVHLQIKYILIGMIIGFIGGSTNYFLWYKLPILPVGNILVSVYVGSIAYAIIRYRLMDLRQVGRVILIYFIDSAIVYAFFNFLVFAYISVWGSVWHPYALLSGLFVAPAFVYGLFSLNKLIIHFVDRYFFYSLYDYRQTITRLSSELNTYNDLDKIIDLIVDTIKKTMGLNRAGVLLINKKGLEVHYKIAKVIGFDVTNGISLVKDSFLTQYLKRTASPLVREELPILARDMKSSREQRKLLDLEHEMTHIEAHLCLPLISGGELRGIIVLGAKQSGDPYTNQDLELLNTVSVQAATAIDNARLYQETKSFNKVLQQKVDEQTSELKKRAEHLEKLLKMREEFLDIASHQLKTPVSVIRGTVSMFMDGSMDKLPDKEKKKFFGNIYQKATKLNVIISDILRASEVDTDEFVIDPKTARPARLEEILSSVHKDLKELADDKKIELKLSLPKKKTSPILTNADFLEQAIYNLVDNAIKYTSKGGVNLSLEQQKDLLKVEVKDTGIGIPQKDQVKIFDKFSRAGNAVNMYADGSGLGLFIVKKIVEAHSGGKVSFESKEGQGTTFTIIIKAAK